MPVLRLGFPGSWKITTFELFAKAGYKIEGRLAILIIPPSRSRDRMCFACALRKNGPLRRRGDSGRRSLTGLELDS